jgi:hypothetical protein
MEVIDVNKGLTQNRILGEYATFYARLMVSAKVLYHDTVKGIANNIKDKSVMNRIDQEFNNYFAVLKDKDLTNEKVKCSKLITIWARAVLIAFLEIEKSSLSLGEKLKAEAEVLGRADVPFTNLMKRCDDAACIIPENAMDEFNCMEYNMTLTEQYRSILNDDSLSQMAKDCSVTCSCILPFISYVFEVTESS